MHEFNGFVVFMSMSNGFIKLLLIILAGIVILGTLNVDLRAMLQKPMIQENFSFIWQGISYVWDAFLEQPAEYLWNVVFINLLWNSFIENLEKIRQ